MMKTIHLTSLFLTAATALASSSTTYAFFAKVNNELEPLREAPEGFGDFRQLIWGNSSADPIEFTYENYRAISANSEREFGIVMDFKSFNTDRTELASVLNIDKKSRRVKNTFFYSCKDSSADYHVILPEGVQDDCAHVELYFLPYDKESKGPVKDSYTPEKEIERIPHVFYAEGETGLEALYSGGRKGELIMFSHGDKSVDPLSFFVQEDYAYTEAGPDSGYAVFANNVLGYSYHIKETNIVWDKNMKLKNLGFLSCKNSKDSKRFITTDPKEGTDCREVDIHILPYDKANRSPVQGSFSE